MTKLNEILDEAERKSKLNFVNECWVGWREARQSTLSRITNYLFLLNTGALFASLAYVTSQKTATGILLSISLFSIGVLLIILHATLEYYMCQKYFSDYRKDVESLYDNKLDWEVFVDRNKQRVNFEWVLHLFGWGSGVSFFVGLLNGILQVG